MIQPITYDETTVVMAYTMVPATPIENSRRARFSWRTISAIPRRVSTRSEWRVSVT